jgi:hypothetical protein
MVELAPRTNATQERRQWGTLARLAERPEWMLAALEPERVRAALERHVREFAAGELRIVECQTPRLMAKDTSGRWRGVYELATEAPDGTSRASWSLRVVLAAPGAELPAGASDTGELPFGDENWSCFLPELRLFCQIEPPEQDLEILPQLIDPAQSRVLLERSIRAGSPTRRDLRIQSSRPEILNYKPGSRCTLGYHFEYAPEDAGRGWPSRAIAKVYREHKGEQAFRGMAALWDTSLSDGDLVFIAEPLAYVPEWKLLVQAPLAEEQTLEQLVRATLREPAPAAMARLEGLVRKVAAGLAALHLSGAKAEDSIVWDERSDTIPEALERMQVVAPELAAEVAPLFDQLLELAAAHPADPAVPSHGSFDSDQVLLAGDAISFIDFDGFCMAEPALDVAHFRAAIMDSGMKLIDDETLHDPAACTAYLDRLSALGDLFLHEYAARAPISRERLALWETWDYFRDSLQLWTKPMLRGALPTVRILEYHLRRMGWEA